jgi:hypothetical protein
MAAHTGNLNMPGSAYDGNLGGDSVPSGRRYGGGGRTYTVNPDTECVCGARREEHNGEFHLGGHKPTGCRRFKTAA